MHLKNKRMLFNKSNNYVCAMLTYFIRDLVRKILGLASGAEKRKTIQQATDHKESSNSNSTENPISTKEAVLECKFYSVLVSHTNSSS